MFHLNMLCILDHTDLSGGMMIGELKMIWKEIVMVYCGYIRDFPGCTEEN
jgi:hypothetical protein